MAESPTAHEFIERLARRLAENGYAVSPLAGDVPGTLATKRGHSAGIFLPFTDFIFLHDLDAVWMSHGDELEALHQRNRAEGESHMKVPRAMRYRVPNTVTFCVSTKPVSAEMIEVAQRSRHAVNSGEKNSLYLVDLSTKRFYSQGLEVDRFSRYGGEWSPSVNPSNRMARMLAWLMAEDEAL